MNNIELGGENIIPDAANLFLGLRNSGYDNVAALEDLIDNSIDAGASNIKINIGDLDRIMVSDDGSGMSMDTLKQAVRLGGTKVHKSATDLGKYGFGLITASISIGRKLTIITKYDGNYHTAVFDLDLIRDENRFTAEFRDSTGTEKTSFKYRTNDADSGTVLIIDKCDRIQYNTADDLIKALKDSVCHTFRTFIRGGKNIFINDGKTLQYADPLFYDNKRTVIRKQGVLNIETENGVGKVYVTAVLVPDFGQKLNRDLGINIKNQGFYFLRNNREIARAVELLEIFKKHNDFNRLRIELQFDSILDDAMNLNFRKHNVSPNDDIINGLKNLLSDEITAIRKLVKEEQQIKKGKSKGQKNPFKPEIGEGAGDISPKTNGENKTAVKEGGDAKKTSLGSIELKTRFKTEEEPLFEVSLGDEKTTVWYNGKSKYYKNSIIGDEFGGAAKKELLDKFVEAYLKACEKNNIDTQDVLNVVRDIAVQLDEKG